MGSRELVVFDTNALVSAVGWRRPERELYDRCRGGKLRLAPSLAQSALESEEAQAAIADLPNFTDEEKTEVSVVEEVSVV